MEECKDWLLIDSTEAFGAVGGDDVTTLNYCEVCPQSKYNLSVLSSRISTNWNGSQTSRYVLSLRSPMYNVPTEKCSVGIRNACDAIADENIIWRISKHGCVVISCFQGSKRIWLGKEIHVGPILVKYAAILVQGWYKLKTLISCHVWMMIGLWITFIGEFSVRETKCWSGQRQTASFMTSRWRQSRGTAQLVG